MNDPSKEADSQEEVQEEVTRRARNQEERVKLYRHIYKLQNRRHLFR